MKSARKLTVLAVWIAFVTAASAASALAAGFEGDLAPLALDDASHGPLTVRASVELPAGGADRSLDAVVLAGLGDTPSAFPSALSLMWAEDRTGWFPTWSLQLHSDLGLLPAALPARSNAAFGTEFVTLASLTPQWGREYEAALSLEPALGVLSIRLRDVASDAVVYRASFDLRPVEEPLFASAGLLRKGDGGARARFAPIATVDIYPHFIPVGVDWSLVETVGGVVRPVPLSRVERDRVESLRLRLDAPRSSGTYAFFAENGDLGIALGSAIRPTETSLLPVPLESLPVGASRIILEYRESGRLLFTDSLNLPVGRIDAEFGEIVAGGTGGARVALTLRGDGKFPEVRVAVEAEIARLDWDETEKKYVERPQGRFALADAALAPSEQPHALELALPEFVGGDGIWKVRFYVDTGAGVPVNAAGETALVNINPAADLKVMSFNLRRPAPDDGPNAWQFREDLVYRVIRELDPDVIGFQEPWEFQLWSLDRALPEYDSIVVQVHPEGLVHNAIYYRRDRFALLDHGRFWLSETPETWRTPSGERPRAVVWGLFEAIGSGRRFYVINTHYRAGQDAAGDRIFSSRVLREFTAGLDEDVPIILTGDFNAAPGSEEHRLLTGAGFFDARSTAARVTGPEGTHHGFTGRVSGVRIDWILLRGPVQPLETHHVTIHDNDRYPSDHLPVYAVLRML